MSDNNSPVDPLTLGVDTHAVVHVAALLDCVGCLLGTLEFDATPEGFAQMWAWATSHDGTVIVAGVEGTGDYGAGLCRWLQKRGVGVIEVNRPNRQQRRLRGKSDIQDAVSAGRAVLSGEAYVIPKDRTGTVEAVRVLHVTRRSAVHNKTMAGNQIKDLIVAADDRVRRELGHLNCRQRVKLAARWRPGTPNNPHDAVRHSIKTLALRWQALEAEIKTTETHLWELLNTLVPRLLQEPGVGLDVASKLVVAAGQNPQRLKNESSFAALCGVSPVETNSGKRQGHHRLNRGGNRQANNALHTVALYRTRSDPETIAFTARQKALGKTPRETTRKLKRALARRFHHILQQELATPQPLT